MNTSKIVLGIVLYVMFCGQTYFAAASDTNSIKTPTQQTQTTPNSVIIKTTTSAKGIAQQQPQQVIVQQRYVRDTSFDNRTTAIEQTQQATDQHIKNLRQDMSTVDTDLRTLFDQNSKQDIADKDISQKLDRIEKMLGNINGRIKKLEERVDQQDFKLKRLKNIKSPALETKESTDPTPQPTDSNSVPTGQDK